VGTKKFKRVQEGSKQANSSFEKLSKAANSLAIGVFTIFSPVV